MRLSPSTLLLLVLTSGCGRGAISAPDPAVSDGDKYHVILENEQVRVLRYHDRPGEHTHLHRHPNAVIYALAPFKRRLTLANGERREVTFEAGDARWLPAQSHVGENVGSAPTDVLLIEIKR
jgi:quercetin dioxygenase-like cupin family protein